jgi:hypothetical protein
MKIFDPTSPPARPDVRLAPRPARLDGLRLVLVENTKFNSDVLLLRLAERLRHVHGMTVSQVHRKRSPSHEVEEHVVPALARQADLVVSGIGD